MPDKLPQPVEMWFLGGAGLSGVAYVVLDARAPEFVNRWSFRDPTIGMLMLWVIAIGIEAVSWRIWRAMRSAGRR